MSTEFSETFFLRLKEALADSGISASELSLQLGKNARYLEMCGRNGTLPDFASVMKICSILGRDIRFFTGQIDDEKQDSENSSIAISFPAKSSNISNIILRDDFREYIERISTELTLQISFYMSGKENCRGFYSRAFFEEILSELISVGSAERIGMMNVNLYIPRFYSVEDVLSLDDVQINTDMNDSLSEIYDEINNDYCQFRLKLFHKYNADVLSRLHFTLHMADFSEEDFDNAECAIIVNDYAFFTSDQTFAITHSAGMSHSVSEIRKLYMQKEISHSLEPDSITNTKKKELKNIASDFLDSLSPESTDKFLHYFDDEEHKKLVRTLMGNFVLVGLPGVGKSSVVSEIMRLCGFEETESSNLYINYRIFDDNGDDTRSSFKKIKKENYRYYIEIREHTVLSTICKAVGKGAILDVGGKEIFYDSVLMKLLELDYIIVNCVYSDGDGEEIHNEKKAFNSYLQHLIDHPEIADRRKRNNLYTAACLEDGSKDLTSEKFRSFIQNLFQKRFSQYAKRSHFSIARIPKDTAEITALKVIAEVLAKRIKL